MCNLDTSQAPYAFTLMTVPMNAKPSVGGDLFFKEKPTAGGSYTLADGIDGTGPHAGIPTFFSYIDANKSMWVGTLRTVA